MYTPPPLPIPIFSYLFHYGISFLILALLVRAIASMFRLDERYAFIRFLARLTDPFIVPLRRVLGQVWILDLSFIVAWFMLAILQVLLVQALPIGW
jgi:YggT family protein